MERDGHHIPFVTSGPYPIRGGNEVRPLVDGTPAFRRICEAVESAQHSVWVTVAFMERDVLMPDHHGSFFDVLDRAAARGVDVRVIFWRSREIEAVNPGTHFSGTEAERRWLEERSSRFLARWDRAAKLYCQHQKSWLVDAGRPGEIAFVGGINLQQNSVVDSDHPPSEIGNTHDVYVEVRGPAATDVHHNFVQRWNEASERGEADGHWPSASHSNDLAFPDETSEPVGVVPVQIQRTVRRDLYRDPTPSPGGDSFPIHEGDPSIVDQYLRAIEAAKRSIYFEDQAIGSQQVVDALHDAVDRGVEVVFLAPADPNEGMVEARRNPDTRAFFESLARLGDSERFTLAGIASIDEAHIYVHAKVALIDDVWATIGSTNLANRSFYGDTELNASFWHGPTVRALRCQLFAEHLARDTTTLDDRAAAQLFRSIALDNADRRARGEKRTAPAFALDPRTYAIL